MPDLLHICTNQGVTSSYPTQKSAAFRPNTNEYWVVVCGSKPSGAYHVPARRFYRSTDGATFNLVVLAGEADWSPSEFPENVNYATATQPVSFVFDESGENLYAVTVTHEVDNGTAYHRTYCQRYSFADDAWYNVADNAYLYNHSPVVMLPDIELDDNGRPMVVSFDGSYSYFFYFNYTGDFRTVAGNPIVGPASIVNTGGDVFVHSTDGTAGTSSYLQRIYKFLGSPAPPMGAWPTTAPFRYTINLPYASMFAAENKIGLLGRSSSTLIFKYLDLGAGGEVSDDETVSPYDVQTYGYGLCHRGGYWHTLHCSTVGDGARRSIRYTDGTWAYYGKIEGTEGSDWSYFGITKQPINPPQIVNPAFGCVIIGTVTPDAKFVFIDDWLGGVVLPPEGDNYWKFGNAIESHLLKFDVETKGAQHYDSLSIWQLILMDMVQIHDAPVFVKNTLHGGFDMGMFFIFTNEFQDWLNPSGEFNPRTLEMHTGVVDAGIPYKKICQEITVDFLFQHKEQSIVNDMQLLVVVANEKGYSNSFYIDKDYPMKPHKLHLPGRTFIVNLSELSVGDTSIRSIELRGVYTGGKV